MDFEREKTVFDKIERINLCTNVASREVSPEGARIINTLSFATCTRAETVNNEIIVEGTVRFVCIYKVDNDIFSIERTERFSINDTVRVNGEGTFCNATAKNTKAIIEAGYINMSCAVCVTGRVFARDEIEMPSEISGEDIRVKYESINNDRLLCGVPIRLSLTEEKELSPRLPRVSNVLAATASVCVKEEHISSSQLVLGGDVLTTVVYSSNDEYQPIVEIKEAFDFSSITDISKCSDNLICETVLNCESVSVTSSFDEVNSVDKLIYSFEISGYALLFAKNEQKIITDMYSIKEKYGCEYSEIDDTLISEKDKFKVSKRFTVNIPSLRSKIARINSLTATVFANNVSFENGAAKIDVSGEVNAIYTSAGDGEIEGLCLPFDINIDCDDLRGDSDCICGISVNAEDVQLTAASSGEAEIRLELSVDDVICRKNKVTVLRNYKKLDDEQLPEFGIIVYNAQRDDTVWSICKSFGVDEAELRSINPNLSAEPVEGDRLFVFRRLTV